MRWRPPSVIAISGLTLAGLVLVIIQIANREFDRFLERRTDAVTAEAQAIARQAAASIQIYSDETRHVMKASIDNIRANGPREFCRAIHSRLEFVSRTIANMAVVDGDGNFLCLAVGEAQQGVSPLLASMGVGKPGYTYLPPFYGEYSNDWLLGLAYTEISDTSGSGPEDQAAFNDTFSIIVWVKLSALAGPLASADSSVLVTLLDDQEVVLARSLDMDAYVGKRLPDALTTRNPEAPDLGGDPRIWSSVVLPELGWRVAVGMPERAVSSSVTGSRNLVWSMAGGALLPITALFLLIAWTTSSVRGLYGGVERALSAGPQFVPIQGPLEVRALGQAFRDAIRRWEDASVALKSVNRELEAKVLERSKALAVKASALEETNRELSQALDDKDRVIRLVSHELRTPLTGVLSGTEAILAGVYGSVNDGQTVALGRVRSHGANLNQIIEKILELSALKKDSSGEERTVVSLASLVQAAADTCAPLLEQGDQHLELDLVDDADVLADAFHLRQAVVNVIDNATKHTPKGGRLGIVIKRLDEPGKVCITIWDSGPGIPIKDRSRVLQPFVQLDDTPRTVSGAKSLGLGLAYAAQVIASLHGRIEIGGEPGEGARITFVLDEWSENARRLRDDI